MSPVHARYSAAAMRNSTRVVMFTTFTPALEMERLISLIVGALPASGRLSLVTLTVAVQACPAVATAELTSGFASIPGPQMLTPR